MIARWKTIRRWVMLSPLAFGSLAGLSCEQILRQSFVNGTIEFVTGQSTGNYQGFAPFGDLLIGLITGQAVWGAGAQGAGT